MDDADDRFSRISLAEAPFLLVQVLFRDQIPSGNATHITGLEERSARDLLAALMADGILGFDTPKRPVSLRFLLAEVEIFFPIG